MSVFEGRTQEDRERCEGMSDEIYLILRSRDPLEIHHDEHIVRAEIILNANLLQWECQRLED